MNSIKSIKPPSLSTSFSESGKRAKKRFDNILNIKAKKTGVLAFALVLVSISVVGIVVSCHKDIPQSRGASEKFSGTAIIVNDTDLFSDSEGKNKIHEFYTLKKNDLVYVIYHENDYFYYIQTAVMDIPSTQGYVSKKAVSFDLNLFNNANSGVVKSGKIYKSPNEDDVYEKSATYVFHIAKRQGEWAEVNLRGGDYDKWVKTADISYDLIPFMIDLSYTNLQRDVDNGHQSWLLDPLEVARDYVYNTLNKTGGEFKVFNDSSVTGSISYSYTKAGEKEIQVVVYQPIKKGESGIWVVNKGTLMRNQIEDVIPYDRQVDANSNAVWRIRLTENIDYINPKTGIEFNFEQEAKKLGINISEYYGHDLDAFIYSVETAKHSSQQYTRSPYIFIFEGTNMIAYRDLQTVENEGFAKNILTTINKFRGTDE